MNFTDERVIPELFDTDRNLLYWHLSRYRFAMGYMNRQDRVLDVACGTGYGAYEMASLAHSVVGVDIDKETIDYCNSHYKARNLDFHCINCVDITSINHGSFNICTSFETIEHLHKEEQPKFISAIRASLCDDGLLIISTPNTKLYNPSGKPNHNPYHLHEFSQDEFRCFLENHFHQVQIFGQRSVSGPILKVPYYAVRDCIKSLYEFRFRLKFNLKNFLDLKDFEFSTFGLEKSIIFIAICRGPKRQQNP